MTTDALLAQLTLEEKAALTRGTGFWYSVHRTDTWVRAQGGAR